ncbi:MAG TPA: DGQHR domain-containing protein, partial [Candidatus Atribacteria bacterium]|nr:DGQHR domain-containing protein [Candidatus Atribacteria bacterium]
KSLRKDIAELEKLKPNIEKAIRKHYGKNMRVTFIFCTKNIKWSENDEADAKGADIVIWREKEISYFKKIADIIGFSAKYQLFAVIHKGKKAIEPVTVPALKTHIGGKQCYTFMVQPERLLKIAYVHHRSPISLGKWCADEGNAYQRMFNKSKLRNIDTFITNGGFFPNNIVINFTSPPKFIPNSTVGDIEEGFLQLPQYYASARIVDGQHRLYGFSNNPKKSSEMIPVLAFENLPKEEEGKIFVTINDEQKKVEANLLWDLYDDVYEDSLDDKNQMLRTISRIIKNLNNRGKSPLKDRIYIPSINEKKDKNGRERLTIATFGNGIKKTGLLKKGGLLFVENWKTSENFATNRIESFFKVVKSLLPEDWEKGEKGFLCSNNGIAVFLQILKEILRYIHYRNPTIIKKSNLDDLEEDIKNLVEPAIDYLREIGENGRNEWRGETSQEGGRKKIADILMEKIKKYHPDFAPHLPPTEEEIGKKLVEETELKIRNLIKQKLKEKYGDKWWKQGVPAGAKDYAKRRMEEEINKAPWV